VVPNNKLENLLQFSCRFVFYAHCFMKMLMWDLKETCMWGFFMETQIAFASWWNMFLWMA